MIKTPLWKKIEKEKNQAEQEYKTGSQTGVTRKGDKYVKGYFDGLDRAQYLVEETTPVKKKKRKHTRSDDIGF